MFYVNIKYIFLKSDIGSVQDVQLLNYVKHGEKQIEVW